MMEMGREDHPYLEDSPRALLYVYPIWTTGGDWYSEDIDHPMLSVP